MTPENIILAGLAFFAVASLIYAFGPKGSAKIAQIASQPTTAERVKAAFEAIEAEGKLTAAKQLVESIGAHYAAEHKAKVVNSISPKDPPAPVAGA